VHQTADDPRIDASPPFAEEERRPRALADKRGPAALDPCRRGTEGRQPDRHDPLLVAFAEHPKNPAVHFEIIDVEAAHLADPDTRGVKKLEKGVIAQLHRLAAGSAAGFGVEKRCSLVLPQYRGQAAPGARGSKRGSMIHGRPPGPNEKPGECADGSGPASKRGAGSASTCALGQPATESWKIDPVRIGDAEPGSMLCKIGDITDVGAHRMWRQATLAGQVRGKGRDRLSQCGRSRRHRIGPPNLAYLGLSVRALAERWRLRRRDAVWGPSHSHKAHADLPGGRGQAPWP
jgi:hypothetical protein